MKILINLFLLVIAWFLLRIVIGISFIYTVCKLAFKGKFQSLSIYFYHCALTLDMSGNIIGQHFFNDLLIKPEGYRFGYFNKTISKTLAVNKGRETMYKFGIALGKLLNWIDKDHLEKSSV